MSDSDDDLDAKKIIGGSGFPSGLLGQAFSNIPRADRPDLFEKLDSLVNELTGTGGSGSGGAPDEVLSQLKAVAEWIHHAVLWGIQHWGDPPGDFGEYSHHLSGIRTELERITHGLVSVPDGLPPFVEDIPGSFRGGPHPLFGFAALLLAEPNYINPDLSKISGHLGIMRAGTQRPIKRSGGGAIERGKHRFDNGFDQPVGR